MGEGDVDEVAATDFTDADGTAGAIVADFADLEEGAVIGVGVGAFKAEGVGPGLLETEAGGLGGHDVGDGLLLDFGDGGHDGGCRVFLLDGLLAGRGLDFPVVRHQPSDWNSMDVVRLTRGKVMSR